MLFRSIKYGFALSAVFFIVGCAPDYSPDTYAANAVQQANKVEPGVVVGFRQVVISANGTVGAVTGGAAGGILGSQATGGGFSSALGAVGGSVVGSFVGSGIEHASGDTTGWEYIVRKPNGDLLSVTQREPAPLPLGQKVLVITGAQARIVADYSVPSEPTPPPEKPKPEPKSETKKTAVEPPSRQAVPTSVAPDSTSATSDDGQKSPPSATPDAPAMENLNPDTADKAK